MSGTKFKGQELQYKARQNYGAYAMHFNPIRFIYIHKYMYLLKSLMILLPTCTYSSRVTETHLLCFGT